MLRRFILLAALCALASPVFAQEIRPLLDSDRIALAGGAGYAFNPAPVKSEGEAGLYLGYPGYMHLSAHAEGVYGFDSGLRGELSAHYRTDLKGLSLVVGYEFGDASQWIGGAAYAVKINPRIVVGAKIVFGLDSEQPRTTVGVRVPLLAGRDS